MRRGYDLEDDSPRSFSCRTWFRSNHVIEIISVVCDQAQGNRLISFTHLGPDESYGIRRKESLPNEDRWIIA